MLKRTITGLSLIAVLFGFILAAYFVGAEVGSVYGNIFIDMLIFVFLAGSAYEMYHCFKEGGYKMFAFPPVAVLLLAYPVFYLLQYYLGQNIGLQGLALVLLTGVLLDLTIFTFKPAKRSLKEIAADKELGISPAPEAANAYGLNDLLANVFVLVYPTAFLALAWTVSFKYSAIFAVLFAIFIPVIGSDMFAYFFGSMIGGKKLCPKISPKKTVAGAVGGLIGSTVCAMAFWLFFEYFNVLPQCDYVPFIAHTEAGWAWKTALIYAALGISGGVVSELGDLAASRIKRAIGVKDYGKIFPGHGGFMDRIDSVMYCLILLLVAFTAIYGY